MDSKQLDCQRVQAGIHEISDRIIHKAVLHDTGLAGKLRRGNTHAEMGAIALGTGAGMTGVRRALIDHFELAWLQPLKQALAQLVRGVRHGARRKNVNAVPARRA